MTDRMKVFRDLCEEHGFLDLFEELTQIFLAFQTNEERSGLSFVGRATSLDGAKKLCVEPGDYEILDLEKGDVHECYVTRKPATVPVNPEWEAAKARFREEKGRDMNEWEEHVFGPVSHD